MSGKMLTEIQEQPAALRRLVAEGWGPASAVARALRERGFRAVMLAARGTSDNAAYYAKYLFEVLLGVPTALASPSTFTLYESEMDLAGVLVIGISQSGESKDVLETIHEARRRGANTLAITNDERSSMAAAADYHLPLLAGKEESVAATKTYTSELLVLYFLIAALSGREDLPPAARRIPEQAEEVLAGRWADVARYRYADHLVVVSRGYNLATARESALKLMETSYVVAQPFSEADLRHGPIAMVTRDFPVVAIVPPGKARASMLELVRNLEERGAEMIVIGGDEASLRKAAASFRIPVSCPEELSPVLYILPAQTLAQELAVIRGLDPDAPRGLSKVTESW